MPQSTAQPPASEAGTCTAEGPETEADFLRMLDDELGKALLQERFTTKMEYRICLLMDLCKHPCGMLRLEMQGVPR